jgi:hypothetical protein
LTLCSLFNAILLIITHIIMKLKSRKVKYPTESALDNHMLETVLPSFITRAAFETTHIPKSREFYLPDEFIWNNPYRSSKKIFQYFHQSKKDNKSKIEELRRMEMMDLAANEQQRIFYIR